MAINSDYGSNVPENNSSRRDVIRKIATSFAIGSLTISETMVSTSGESNAANAAENPATIYKSGKAPIVPGAKAKDKNDLSGTRKDPTFFRSLAQCKVCAKFTLLTIDNSGITVR